MATLFMLRALLLSALVCVSCFAGETRPVLMVIEIDPWLMPFGADDPTFVLYDDGTIIYRSDKRSLEVPLVSRKVADAQLAADGLLPTNWNELKEFYKLSNSTDQPTTVIWTPTKSVAIYGDWRKARDSGNRTVSPLQQELIESEKVLRQALPEELPKALAGIDEQRKLFGDAWLPSDIEMMFWPWEYALKSIAWPQEWESLPTKDTSVWKPNSFSVFVPASQFSKLRNYVAIRPDKAAVLINGKKMAVTYRFPLPGELAWKKE